MREYAKISCSLWNSRKFTGLPNDDARYLYLYLHTCPHVNMVGCFVLPEGYACADLGWSPERYRDGIATLSKANLISFDRSENVVRIVGFLEHDPFCNPKHAAGAVKVAEKLPRCIQRTETLTEISGMRHVKAGMFSYPFDTVSKPYRNPEPEPEPDPEPEPLKEGGGGIAGEVEVLPPEKSTFRERILVAMGVDPCGLTGRGGQTLGQNADMARAARWLELPGLTEDLIVAEIESLMRRKRDGPPSSFSYFNRAMERLSGALTAPPLEPIPPTRSGGSKNDRARFDQAHREYTRRLAAGEIQRGPDPSDPFAGR